MATRISVSSTLIKTCLRIRGKNSLKKGCWPWGGVLKADAQDNRCRGAVVIPERQEQSSGWKGTENFKIAENPLNQADCRSAAYCSAAEIGAHGKRAAVLLILAHPMLSTQKCGATATPTATDRAQTRMAGWPLANKIILVKTRQKRKRNSVSL